MAVTSFTEVYNRAMFKLADYSFLNLEEATREQIFTEYLKMAIVDFKHSCSVDLSDYDEEARRFNVKLDDEEIEILALGVAYHWLNQKTLNSRLLKNLLTRTDYTSYSPANLLNAMSNLRENIRIEYRGKINEYSFRCDITKQLKAGN